MACNPQLNTVGFVFDLKVIDCDDNLAVGLDGSTSRTIYLKKPDGTVITRSGSYKTDGTDGFITYTTIAGDLDIPGRWAVQYAIDLPSFQSATNTEYFMVDKNIY